MDPITMGGIKIAAGAIKNTIGGLADITSSVIGGRARRQEEREAIRELGQRKSEYENFQFTNPYANMQNAFEDMTINQQQAQFQSQQQQQALASTMSGMQQAAGSSGIAALAQAMAGQQAQNLQAASASIGAQEQNIQMQRASEASRLQQLAAEGASAKQAQEFSRAGTLYGIAAERKGAATAARDAARQQLIGGISKVMTAGADAIAGNKGEASPSGGVSGGEMPTLGNTSAYNAGQGFLNRTASAVNKP